MKKTLVICAALASLAMVTSCQKEQKTVTLGASIEQDAKMYINSDRTPYWSEGDEVYVNDRGYGITLTSTGNQANIENVIATDNYYAIFPASIVEPNAVLTSGSANVILTSTQVYETVTVGENTYQKVNMPMVAKAENGSTDLGFRNVCGLLRVHVTNNTDAAINITGITVTSSSALLSGNGSVTINGSNGISMGSGSRSVTLAKSDNSVMTSINSGSEDSLDIIMPAFSNSNITVRVFTSTGYQDFSPSGAVSITNNAISDYDVTVSSVSPAAVLDVSAFIRNLPDYPNVVFTYGVNNTSSTLLSTDGSIPIYGLASAGGPTFRTYYIYTSASAIVPNSTSLSGMFSGKERIRSVDFGGNFITNGVTNMSDMFNGCTGMSSLNLTNFDMNNVTNKSNMCSGLASRATTCNITCSSATQTALLNGTSLPTSGVTFSWTISN